MSTFLTHRPTLGTARQRSLAALCALTVLGAPFDPAAAQDFCLNQAGLDGQTYRYRRTSTSGGTRYEANASALRGSSGMANPTVATRRRGGARAIFRCRA